MQTTIRSLLFLAAGILLTACAGNSMPTPFIGAEPEVDSTLTRAPRTLRLYFETLPDVARSSLSLRAEDGRELNLRGMHTMGANDLMVEINDQVPAGRYTVHWNTVVEGDAAEYEGSFDFVVQAN